MAAASGRGLERVRARATTGAGSGNGGPTIERFSARPASGKQRHRRTQFRWPVGAPGTGRWLEHRVLAGAVNVSGAGCVLAVCEKPGESQGATADQRRLGVAVGLYFDLFRARGHPYHGGQRGSRAQHGAPVRRPVHTLFPGRVGGVAHLAGHRRGGVGDHGGLRRSLHRHRSGWQRLCAVVLGSSGRQSHPSAPPPRHRTDAPHRARRPGGCADCLAQGRAVGPGDDELLGAGSHGPDPDAAGHVVDQ